MSCHWSRSGLGGSREAERGGSAEIYFELARAGRFEDFRWFALSQGVALEVVEELWRDTREVVGAAGHAPEATIRESEGPGRPL